ncbi:Imm47 family immunity protein, partial [Bacillus wiedmannii]
MDLEHLKKDIWYGEVSNHTIKTLKSNLRDSVTETECFILINELLKLGDFSVKGLLIELMNSTRNGLVLHLCTRLFCSVATHDDLLETNNLKFLSSAS